MRRNKIGRSKSKKIFRKSASRTHKKNLGGHGIMRGGYRL